MTTRTASTSTIHLKTPDELAMMREAGRIVARTHQALREAVRPGITTKYLDRIAEEVIRDHGATPVFLGYPKTNAPNFPASITASINHELVHGIPSDHRFLKEGDIISLDVGCTYQGFVGDAAFTMGVGQISAPVRRLLDVTDQALYEGIAMARLGNETKDISQTIQRFVEKHGYSVVRDYTGHGVGHTMHEDPQVPNFWAKNGKRGKSQRDGMTSVPLEVGMTFAIEPMVNTGRPETTEMPDKWTVISKDRSLCAHSEHTVAVTDGDPLILTRL